MDITVFPGKLQGTVQAIPSKSQAHRLLICSAFADAATKLICPQTNQDIEATADCLRSLGADISYTDGAYYIIPIRNTPAQAELNCFESGSTLRFMLPIVGALGIDTMFYMSGRLPHRPVSPMWEEMERSGCMLSRPSENTIRCTGQLQSGNYTIDGSVSSQFITGLLFAMALMPGKSNLNITGKAESWPYIEMTLQALAVFGIHANGFQVDGGRIFHSPGTIHVEGDWSNAAFFLTAQALGSQLSIQGLDMESPQGDREIIQLLPCLLHPYTVSVANIPDLVPILAVFAGAMQGAVFTDIRRLRLKESDRVATVAAMLEILGASVSVTENAMDVQPAHYHGGLIDSAGDHRIAMAAAIASTVSNAPITILRADCVSKSYPSFWEEFKRLGGKYEQYIR